MALSSAEKPKFANALLNGGAKLENATGACTVGSNTNTVTVVTAGANGAIIDSARILSTDSAARNVVLQVWDGVNARPLNTTNVPANSGTNGTAAVVDPLSGNNAAFAAINNQGKRYIRLKAGESIIAGVLVAVTAATAIWVAVSGADFTA